MPQKAEAKDALQIGDSGPLTLEALILALPQSAQPEAVQTLQLSGRGITAMPAQLAFLRGLRKLDLAQNRLIDIRPLAKLSSMSQLKLADNRVADLRPLATLKELTVLDVSRNELTSLAGVEGLPKLKAVIAPENRLTSLPETMAAALETLVVSRNPTLVAPDSSSSGGGGAAAEATSALAKSLQCVAPSLRKLSMAHCGLECFPVLDMPLLNELRLSGNRLREFQEGTAFRSLKILDVASNHLDSVATIRPFAFFLQQLALHGNPVAVESGSPREVQFRTLLARTFKSLKLLDGRSFTPPTKQEVAEHRKASRVSTNTGDDDVSVPAPADAGSGSVGKTRRRIPSPARDVVYEGDVPAAPATAAKSYVRAAKKIHRPEQQPQAGSPSSGASPGGKRQSVGHAAGVIDRQRQQQGASSPASKNTTAGGPLTGAAAVAALAAAANQVASPGGW